MTQEKPNPESAKRGMFSSMDVPSVLSFASAGIGGLFGLAINIRYNFWQAIVKGFGEISTPFQPILDRYQKQFQANADACKNGTLAPKDYLQSQRSLATELRNTVFEKLDKEFDIPSHGIRGWTIGTAKRFREIGVNGRLQSGLSFAAVGATVIGGIALLRHNKHAIDRIEDKIDANESQLGR